MVVIMEPILYESERLHLTLCLYHVGFIIINICIIWYLLSDKLLSNFRIKCPLHRGIPRLFTRRYTSNVFIMMIINNNIGPYFTLFYNRSVNVAIITNWWWILTILSQLIPIPWPQYRLLWLSINVALYHLMFQEIKNIWMKEESIDKVIYFYIVLHFINLIFVII